ncbi:MAG: YidC/Oxa1 family insertase periplasmic-domain containing protein, partial [Planctomycetota bacterium]
MGKQDTLRNLLIAGAVFLLIMSVGPTLFPPAPPRPPVDQTVAPQSSDRPTDAVPQTTPTTPAADRPSTATESPVKVVEPRFVAVEAESVATYEMGAAPNIETQGRARPSDPYRMRLVLTNVGAAVESATLTDHAATLNSPDRYQLLAPATRPSGATHRSLSIDKINVDGVDLPLHDKKWRTDGVKNEPPDGSGEGQSVAFSLDIHHDGAPVLQLLRSYRLPKQPVKLGRHDLHSDIAVANFSDSPHRVIITYRGGLGVPQSNPRDDRVIDVGLQTAPGRVAGARKMQTEATTRASQSVPLYTPTSTQPDQRLAWAATGNTYFTCTLAPLATDGKAAATTLAEVSAFDADGDPTTGDDATLRFVTIPANLAPKGTISYATAIYVGEKDGHAFRGQPDYRERNYYYQISQGFGWCTFTWLVELMIWLLNSLFFVVRDFGVAIIILVLIVRAMLHPLTKKGQVNMVRMQHRMGEMAPKIEEIKKKFANDKVRMNQEMMKLNINPAGQLMTCLPMFIQMPIWVALFL